MYLQWSRLSICSSLWELLVFSAGLYEYERSVLICNVFYCPQTVSNTKTV